MPPSRKVPTKYFCDHIGCTNTGGFLRPADLERHAWTHVAKSKWPYHCEYCGKAYIQPSNLNAHIRVHHTKEQPYSCDFCNEKFYAAYQKSMHLKEHRATTARHVRSTTNVSYKRRSAPYVHHTMARRTLPLLGSPGPDPLIESESTGLELELLSREAGRLSGRLSDCPSYYPHSPVDKFQPDWMQAWIASLEAPYPSPPQSLPSSPPASPAPDALQSSRDSPSSAPSPSPSPSPSLSVESEMNSLLCAEDLEAVLPAPSLFLNTDHYFGLSELTSLWDRIPSMDFQSGDLLSLGMPQFSDMPIY